MDLFERLEALADLLFMCSVEDNIYEAEESLEENHRIIVTERITGDHVGYLTEQEAMDQIQRDSSVTCSLLSEILTDMQELGIKLVGA